MTTALEPRPDRPLSDEEKLRYAGIWLLKKMDLDPRDGGMEFPLFLPSELTPLDEVLHDLQLHGHVRIHRRKERWELTPEGIHQYGGGYTEYVARSGHEAPGLRS